MEYVFILLEVQGDIMAVNIKTLKHKGINILQVTGRLINIDSEKFQNKLELYCEKNDKFAVIDITNVNFIDSFGLGTLVKHFSKYQKTGNKFLILNENPDPTTYIQRLFEITGLKDIFQTVSSLQMLDSVLGI